MSFLATLFGLGAAAIAFPFLFHLIRRTPKGQLPFSSLMFLKPSPPRITRRSRLENLLLLFLRMGAIVLIAFAFMRPYFFSASLLTVEQLPGRRVAVLVDTSASMKRADLWQQAVTKTRELVANLDDKDDVALFTFDDHVKSLLQFDSGSSNSDQLNSSITELLTDQEPGWGGSDLAGAMMTAADYLISHQETEQTDSQLQLVVISDLQNGSRVNALASYQWPEKVRVQFQAVDSDDVSNANVRIMPPEEDADEQVIRVQVNNTRDSRIEQFQVASDNAVGRTNDAASEIPVYVPPGTSRVIKVPLTATVAKTGSWTLSGDKVDFDNRFYVAPIVQRTVHVRYFGSEAANDPTQMQYFLSKAMFETPTQKIVVVDDQTESAHSAFDLCVVTRQLDGDASQVLQNHLNSGGTALIVLTSDKMADAMSDLVGIEPVEIGTATKPNSRYRMLSRIDFSHPLFVDFANPRFNDFTKIKFWKTQPVSIQEEENLIASFDDGFPAIWQNQVGKGRVIGMASGWNPEQSQLALSSKFVPLMSALLNMSVGGLEIPTTCTVNQPLPLPEDDETFVITLPDGSTVNLEDSETSFAGTIEPGLYRIATAGSAGKKLERAFAVNLEPRESDIAKLDLSRIESFGVSVGLQPSIAEQTEAMKTMQRVELENSQKIWKWLIIGAVVLLIGETCLAGRTARMNQQNEQAELVTVTE